ncbi:MAG: L-ribulose-5-phosphate 4-epimerase AraD [Gemmatimonadaceae bacterium]|nr:L-ribulose-5-phosphate 4-epimerase AraD [Gemmatimonadaceae bacterium]
MARARQARASKALRESVCAANIALFERGLAKFTFGNASGVDRELGLIVIKPSGVGYDRLTPAMLVVTDLQGTVVEGDLRPSSDLPTHAALFRAWERIGGIVHTHSMYATVFAQARRDIPCLGTTHADYFYGAIPCTKPLTQAQVNGAYELETGHAIVRRLRGHDPLMMPAALVANHAPFCWGRTVAQAVDYASYLEEVATMAHHTLALSPKAAGVSRELLDKHYLRKHGRAAYYGQSQ